MKKVLVSIATLIAIVFTSCKSENIIDNEDSSFELDATNFKGTIGSGTITLDPSLTYKLTGALVVAEGATLTIQQGLPSNLSDLQHLVILQLQEERPSM